jgi:hypothetical protein
METTLFQDGKDNPQFPGPGGAKLRFAIFYVALSCSDIFTLTDTLNNVYRIKRLFNL